MDSFQFSLAVLLLYRTWWIFRIGSRWDPCSGSKSEEPYSGCQESGFWPSLTGLSPFVVSLSRELQVRQLVSTLVQTPHCLSLSRKLRFVLCCFQSPLLTASRLISLPGVNKMFSAQRAEKLSVVLNSSSFNSLRSLSRLSSRVKRMSYSVMCGSISACDSPHLFPAYKDLRRLSSQTIHQTAWELAIFILDLWLLHIIKRKGCQKILFNDSAFSQISTAKWPHTNRQVSLSRKLPFRYCSEPEKRIEKTDFDSHPIHLLPTCILPQYKADSEQLQCI